MSKAFTREDDAAPDVGTLRPVRAAGGPRRPITPEGHRALRAQVEALEAPAPEGATDAERADRRRRLEAARAVLDQVEETQPVPAGEGDADNPVRFGAWVELEDEEGARVRWRLVGPDEADVRARALSLDAPLAQALLGRRVGETVTFERPRDSVDYTIVAVSLTPPLDS